MEDKEIADMDGAAPEAAPAGGDEADSFDGVDMSAVDAALGLDPKPVAAPAPAADPAPLPVAEEPATEAITIKPTDPPPVQLDSAKLLAIMSEKRRVTDEVAQERSKVAQERAELEQARKDLADSKALLDLARRNPAKFLKEHAKVENLEQYARDVYFASKGEKAPEAYQGVQRQREVETEIEELRNTVRSYEERITQQETARENERYINQYKAEAKEAVAKSDQKSAPWVARAFAKNPEQVMAHLVGLASHVARSGAEVPKPQDLIPILEQGMVEQFGNYDFGEAKPVTKTTTLNASLSAAPRRPPVGVPGDDDIDELIVRGIKSGEHLRE